ncbi:MAG: hypothetical protein DRP74_07600 [Candidatus Omnitrophota bacterium]|nr:MAG: hypothetical protein DRP74_07600 [Candidatus Omnitrophota bacterium]
MENKLYIFVSRAVRIYEKYRRLCELERRYWIFPAISIVLFIVSLVMYTLWIINFSSMGWQIGTQDILLMITPAVLSLVLLVYILEKRDVIRLKLVSSKGCEKDEKGTKKT